MGSEDLQEETKSLPRSDMATAENPSYMSTLLSLYIVEVKIKTLESVYDKSTNR